MIDTVAIILEREDFLISKPKKFNPSAEGLIMTPYYTTSYKGFIKCVNNPEKDEVIKYGYLPRLTLFGRKSSKGFTIQLKIEFSAPKLLFGNNFEELDDRDFNQLISELKIKLQIMGIVTTEDKLRNAKVSTIHFSKNIVLDNSIRCSFILNELRKINLDKCIDLNNTDYRNNGHAVRYHTNSYEIVFYDKLKDLERSKISEKRSIEKDNWMQLDLFNKEDRLKKNDILRFEVRLNSRSLTKILNILNIGNLSTFQALFSKSISRKALLHYTKIILDNWMPVNKPEITPEELYSEIYRNNSFKPNKILQMMGALYIINSIGYLGLRNFMEGYSNRTWYRLKSELEKIDLKNNYNLILLTDIIDKIDKFETTKLKLIN